MDSSILEGYNRQGGCGDASELMWGSTWHAAVEHRGQKGTSEGVSGTEMVLETGKLKRVCTEGSAYEGGQKYRNEREELGQTTARLGGAKGGD